MVFADSSGFIAAFDVRDGAHAKTAAAWRQIAKARERLVTTQLVLAETVTYLRRRGGWERSRLAGAAILESPLIEVAGLGDEQLAAARSSRPPARSSSAATRRSCTASGRPDPAP